MKSILLIINWLIGFCVLSIDMETAPFWAVLAAITWFGVSVYLLRYARILEVKYALAQLRRFWRTIVARPFDFDAFNKNLEKKLNGK